MINSKLDNITLYSLKEVQPCDFMFLTYLHTTKGQIRNIRLSINLNMYFKCSKENRLVKIEAVLLSTHTIIMFWLIHKKIIFVHALLSGGLYIF